MTEKQIAELLHSKYTNNCEYRLSNAYIFGKNWESDFFIVRKNGYCMEFEIKISRSDFFADKKKVEKHMILEHQKKPVSVKQNGKWTEVIKDAPTSNLPNKFYYVVPEGLITAQEIPSYAGLMYVSEKRHIDIKTIKEAPFLHKDKLELEKKLCKKFYFYWLQEKHTAKFLSSELERLQKKYEPQLYDMFK